jgi:hypothetical protein
LGWRFLPILAVANLLFLYAAVAIIRGDMQSLTPREKRLVTSLTVAIVILGAFGTVLGYLAAHRSSPKARPQVSVRAGTWMNELPLASGRYSTTRLTAAGINGTLSPPVADPS